MKVTATVWVMLATVLSSTVGREFDYCYSYESDPYLQMGTKTAYQFVYGRGTLRPVPNCQPTQIWMLSRHGTRFPGRKSITKLATLPKLRDQIIYNHENRGNGRLCEADLLHLKNWKMNPDVTENRADYLTSQGVQDMRLLAKRLLSAFPEVLRANPQDLSYENYKFRATDTQRTQASMEAFMDGLFNSTNALPVINPSGNDTLLHAYKNCPTWANGSPRERNDSEAYKFMEGTEYQHLIHNVSQRLGFPHDIRSDSIQLMYEMCRYEKAWEVDRLSVWCSVFSQQELKTLEYLEDLDYYYHSGPGRDVNAKLGCPVIKDMFSHFRNRVENGSLGSEPKGIFYFAHTVTVQSLLSALGIGKEPVPLLATNHHSLHRRSYRTSVLGSFASNLVAIFYRCMDESAPFKVMFYLDESPVYLEGCKVGLCDWSFLEEKFGRTAKECTLDFCYNSNSAAGVQAHATRLLLGFLALLGLRSLLAH